MSATPMTEGKIVQCIGAVIDIQFARESCRAYTTR